MVTFGHMFCRPSQRALVALLLCIRAAGLGAKEPASVIVSDANFRVTRWTATDGLPQNSIKTLVQTRDGYLWLGTLKGLARFDGIRFQVFDHGNTPELIHDSINELVEDRKEGLWINAHGSLLHYHDHGFQRFGAEHGIGGVEGPLCAAADGGVWF